jgi:signal transduction histidine kinase
MRAFLLCIALILLSHTSALSTDSFEFKQYEDTAFLPYRIKILEQIQRNPDARMVGGSVMLWRPRFDDTSKATYFTVNLPKAWEDPTFTMDVASFPPVELLRQAAIRLIPTTVTYYCDSINGNDAVLIVGFYNDSVWALRYDPRTAEYSRRFLQTGDDGSGDGRWEPDVNVPLIDDYDYDGQVEAFVHVKPIRDKGVRTLYCLDLETLEIEWSLPVALGFGNNDSMYRLPDSSDPGIIFVARGSRQGKVDSNYNELFRYYSVIDTCGKVRVNKIIQYSAFPVGLIANEAGTRFYMYHQLDPISTDQVDSLVDEVMNGTISHETPKLSALDGLGNVVRSREVASEVRTLWLIPYKGSEKPYLFAYHFDKRVRVYDSTLALIAESEPMDDYPGHYAGTIKLKGNVDALLFFSGIYSTEFEQIARFDADYTPQSLTYDRNGSVTQLLLSGNKRAEFVQIERRGWWTMLTIVYFRYKIYIMVALTALLVGLVVTNHYRSRTRKNLIIISEQKAQLEQAQLALREAQAQLVAQEKFKQAKDIAGGFAHEIRNALSPVRNALAVIGRMDPERLEPRQLERSRSLIDRSVSQAIQLTKRISEYAHLEQPVTAAAVDLGQVIKAAIEQHRDSLEERGVEITIPDTFQAPVSGDSMQYEIVFSNLISNASDALIGAADPHLTITCSKQDKSVIVKVADNGPGIPSEDIDRIFDFFYSTKPDSGTGVGLAIVKKTMEMYGGSVTVNSTPGSGTAFVLRFPVFERHT